MAEEKAAENPSPAVLRPPAARPAPAGARPMMRPGPGSGPGGPRRRPFFQRRKVCRFCAEKVTDVDYKQIQILRSFTTDRGKMLSRRVTGNCAKHQRVLTRAIQRARAVALLPYVVN